MGSLLLNQSSSNKTKEFNHFLQCTDQPTGPLFWSGFCVISFLLGVPASLMVLGKLLHRHHQGVFKDIFMLNLNLIDLTFTVILPPIVCNYMFLHIKQISMFSAFMHSFPMCGRPLFMACICGDCYFAVVHPILYKTNKNVNKIRMLTSLTVWLLTFCYGSLITTTDEAFSTKLICPPLVVALPVITFCNVSILRALRKPDPSGNRKIHPQKKRAFHTLFNSFVITFTAYLPPAIVFTFAEELPIGKTQYFCTLTFYGLCFCTAGCVIMPVLFLNNLGKMDHLKAWLRKC